LKKDKRDTIKNKAMTNYVIWGFSPESTEEEILLEKMPNGEYITSVFTAMKAQSILENKYHCTNCKIQRIDLNDEKEIINLLQKSVNI
jgi:hypothetical protein